MTLKRFSILLMTILALSSIGMACSYFEGTTPESLAINEAWLNGTSPVIQQLRRQGVEIEIEKSSYVALISNIPTTGRQFYIFLHGTPYIPELQIFSAGVAIAKEKTSIVTINHKITVKIGLITYSFELNEDFDSIFSFFATENIREQLSNISRLGNRYDEIDYCYYYMFNSYYCFDIENALLNSKTSLTILIKYFFLLRRGQKFRL